jgi:hypothetical protein
MTLDASESTSPRRRRESCRRRALRLRAVRLRARSARPLPSERRAPVSPRRAARTGRSPTRSNTPERARTTAALRSGSSRTRATLIAPLARGEQKT